jgi:hypothetical protein
VNQEIWQPIPDFPGYEVSDHGRVRSYWRRVGLGRGRGFKSIMVPKPQSILRANLQAGYPSVCLSRNRTRPRIRVHRLVLLAFVGPCPPGMECCHKDGIRANVCLINLRWDTRGSNNLDRIRHGTGPHHQGMDHPRSKLTDTQVIRIRDLHNSGVDQATLGKLYGVSRTHINRIVHDQAWLHLS